MDTSNPPGNEIAGTHYLAGILEQAGIEYEIAESAPERANLWDRLPASDPANAKLGIVLLHHIDVVSASAGHWDMPPYSGAVKDGFVYVAAPWIPRVWASCNCRLFSHWR